MLCEGLARALRLSRLAARVLYQRGLREVEEASRFLSCSLREMRSPFLFEDMERAVDRVLLARARGQKVLVYGDYDVDGLTSTAILVHFLRHAGMDPLCHVPDRLREGYGFHADCIDAFAEEGVKLIITVDCGITGVEAVERARRKGVDVIVTDHHECGETLPSAHAVLNPKAPDAQFPFRDLAGVGVAFYLVVALRSRMRERGMWNDLPEPNLREYLDLVALGTLADMVPLREENRIFVKYGLEEILAARRPGVSMLSKRVGLRGDLRYTRPLLFKVIPMINAPGRLGCAMDALRILLCDDPEEAAGIAGLLEELNGQRRSVEGEVYREALEMARRQAQDENRSALVLAGQGWHRGILGIVASRLARDFLRPVVLVSLEGDRGKGSIRTIENVEILDALVSCSDLLDGYGGHRMAAGLSLKEERLPAFRDAFERAVARKLEAPGALERQLHLDVVLEDPSEITGRVVAEFEQMAPFGEGNMEPVVGLVGMRIVDKRIVGTSHLKLVLEGGGARFDAIGFQMAESGVMESEHARWNVACQPRMDRWNGRTKISLRILDLQPG